MGYTHYWRLNGSLSSKDWSSMVEDMKKVTTEIQAGGVKLAGGMGEGNPIFDNKEIWFNGAGEDDSHETFAINPNDRDFQFCKTARKPYDLAVTACLIIAKWYYQDKIEVSSDGDSSEWQEARDLVQNTLGYGFDFTLRDD